MIKWPFQDPRNVAVFTTWTVLRGRRPIVLVRHDAYDGAWVFLSDDPFDMQDAAVVALEEIALHDPSVCELADLPEGWHAIRNGSNGNWERKRTELSADHNGTEADGEAES